MTLPEIKMKRYIKIIKKNYRHFDSVLNVDSAKKFLENVAFVPNKIASYRFLPFITYEKESVRYRASRHNKNAKVSKKKRPISLVAHHDALIYATYADKLTRVYEKFLTTKGIEYVPTAYRKGRNLSNVTAAKEVVDFIVDTKGCWIIKGDFKGFFDNLRHSILKRNLLTVLNVPKLEPDWQAVIKALTKYRYVDDWSIKKSLARCNFQSKGPYVKNREQLGILQNKFGLHLKGPNQTGIPQGTSLSAVLANVYMCEFDIALKELTRDFGGMYRRYSDDFIVVIPTSQLNDNECEKFVSKVQTLSSDMTSLVISPDKTKVFKFEFNNNYKNNTVYLCGKDRRAKSKLDYLGFEFNGTEVRMRDKSVYKFHYKSKRAIKLLVREENDRAKIIEDRIVPVSKMQRYVWNNGSRVPKVVTQKPKQIRYLRRLKKVRETINSNLSQSKFVNRMYLSYHRPGDEYSMVGYARRAQKNFEKNNGRYDVYISKQLMHQVIKNQRMRNRMKRSNPE